MFCSILHLHHALQRSCMQTSVQAVMMPQAARSTDPLHSIRHVTSYCAWPQHPVVCKSALRLGSALDFDLMKYLPDGGVYEGCLSCPRELQDDANLKTLLKCVSTACLICKSKHMIQQSLCILMSAGDIALVTECCRAESIMKIVHTPFPNKGFP